MILTNKTNTMKNLIEKCQSLGYRLDINEELLTAKVTKIKSKAMFPKPEFWYRYRTKERMIESIQEFITRKEEVLNYQNDRKKKIAEARENMNHDYKVGEIYYDSWGYDQTNIDFYKVLEAGKKSITMVKIASKTAENQPSGYSSMSAFVVPNPDFKIGKPFKKIVQVRYWNDKISYGITSKHGCFSKYTEGKNGVYESWYA